MTYRNISKICMILFLLVIVLSFIAILWQPSLEELVVVDERGTLIINAIDSGRGYFLIRRPGGGFAINDVLILLALVLTVVAFLLRNYYWRCPFCDAKLPSNTGWMKMPNCCFICKREFL